MIVLWLYFRRKPVSREEAAATALGVVGAILLMLDAKHDKEVTVWGDFICLLGAAVMAGEPRGSYRLV